MSEPSRPALRAAARTIRQLFEAAGATGSGTLAERLARGWRAPSADDLNAALVLCADHELNTSSFTARCVASTDAPVHNVLLAALCALEGRRHGGVEERVDDLLRAAERDGARSAWRRALSRDGWVPGFSHRVLRLYPDGDPRANELLGRIELPSCDPAVQLITFARRELGMLPSLEFALAALVRNAALPRGAAFGLFALGRSAGWIAHAFEAAAEGKLIRPRARYTGPAPDIGPRGGD
jgi:citrate synthase